MLLKRLKLNSGNKHKLKQLNDNCVIISSYFTSKVDPQINSKPIEYQCRPNDLTYISSWLATSLFYNLSPILIVDDMQSELINLLEQKGVIVVKADLGAMSTNDERFFCYAELLNITNFKSALFTDVSDVLIKKNPFNFFEMKKRICLGNDMETTPLVGNNAWMVEKTKALLRSNESLIESEDLTRFLRSKLVNAGVVGGPIIPIRKFIDNVVEFLAKCPVAGNWNMIAVNFVASKLDEDENFQGAPFTSKFKKFNYEFDGYVVHK